MVCPKCGANLEGTEQVCPSCGAVLGPETESGNIQLPAKASLVERYTRIYTAPRNLYYPGAPVMIRGGMLVRDNKDGRCFVQLSIQNVCPRVLRAVRVRIRILNEAGNQIGNEKEHTYSDLAAGRDKEFGKHTLLFLQEENAAAFEVSVTEVSLDNGQVWYCQQPWKPEPEQRELSEAFSGDKQTKVKLYRQKCGQKCRCTPAAGDGLWFCACGGINSSREKKCHLCGVSFAALVLCLDEVETGKTFEERNPELIVEWRAEVAEKRAKETAEVEQPPLPPEDATPEADNTPETPEEGTPPHTEPKEETLETPQPQKSRVSAHDRRAERRANAERKRKRERKILLIAAVALALVILAGLWVLFGQKLNRQTPAAEETTQQEPILLTPETEADTTPTA